MSYIPYVIEQTQPWRTFLRHLFKIIKRQNYISRRRSKRSDCKQYCGTDVILRVRRSGEGY